MRGVCLMISGVFAGLHLSVTTEGAEQKPFPTWVFALDRTVTNLGLLHLPCELWHYWEVAHVTFYFQLPCDRNVCNFGINMQKMRCFVCVNAVVPYCSWMDISQVGLSIIVCSLKLRKREEWNWKEKNSSSLFFKYSQGKQKTTLC